MRPQRDPMAGFQFDPNIRMSRQQQEEAWRTSHGGSNAQYSVSPGGGYGQLPQFPQSNPTGQQSYRGYEQWAPSYSYPNQGIPQMQAYNPMQNWNPNAGQSYANQWGQALQNAQNQFQYPTWNQVQQAGAYYSQQPNRAISGILGGFAQNQQAQQAAVQGPTAYDSQYQEALANSQRYAPGTPERTQADNALKMLQGRMEQVYQQRQAQYGPSSFGGSYGYTPSYGGYSPYVAYAGPEITSQAQMNNRYTNPLIQAPQRPRAGAGGYNPFSGGYNPF
jgi:hypothetical protein